MSDCDWKAQAAFEEYSHDRSIKELQADVNELKELVEYLQDRVKKLKSVGDELINYVGDGTSESNYRLLVDAWEKAKGKI